MSNISPNASRVLVAVDGSPASLEALRVGHRMATLLVIGWSVSRLGSRSATEYFRRPRLILKNLPKIS